VRTSVAAFALALLGACAGGNPVIEGTPPSQLPHQQILGVSVVVHGTASVTRRTATIEAMDNYYTPTIFKGAPGAKVLIVLRNGGFTTHNFTFPGLDINTDVKPGDLRDANVTFPASGQLEFFCRFHRTSSAMIGALESDPGLPTPK
jgi:plastocyanin